MQSGLRKRVESKLQELCLYILGSDELPHDSLHTLISMEFRVPLKLHFQVLSVVDH